MKRILVINPFGIGDAIFSMGVVEALRKAYPDATIGFLCNERTVELVRLDASVDQTFIFNRGRMRRLWKKNPFLFFKKLRALMGMIRGFGFDTAFDLSLGREYAFFCWLIGIKRRIGFDYKGRGLFLTDKVKMDGYSGEPVAQSQMRLLSQVGITPGSIPSTLPIKVSELAKKEVSDLLRKKRVLEHDLLIAVAPGGGKSWGSNAIYKQWDCERFAQAADRFCEGKRSVVLLLGDRSERDLLEKTALLLRAPSILMAGEPIEKVCAMLLRAGLLCGNDGGLIHLANALGVKTVSIFGPVDEKVYGPTGDSTVHAVVSEPVPCRPCYQKFHFPSCPHQRRCLGELSVDKVVEAMKKVMTNVIPSE